MTLDGSASYNVAGDPIATYAWTQTSGPPVVLTAADGPHPTFTTESTDATYTFDLTVTTVGSSTSTDSVTVTSSDNLAPVANAGPDQTGKVAGATVTLEGSASDANLDPLTYSWTQTGGPSVTLADPTTRRPSFVVPRGHDPAGRQLHVRAHRRRRLPGGTGTDSVTVTSVASTPTVTVAKARSGGTCTNFCTGDLLTLSANITNPDGERRGGLHLRLVADRWPHDAVVVDDRGPPHLHAAFVRGQPDHRRLHQWHRCRVADLGELPDVTASSSRRPTRTSPRPLAALAAHASTLPTRPVANAGPAQQ